MPVDSILYGGLSVLGRKCHSGYRRWRGGPQARLSPQAGVAEGGRSLLVSRTRNPRILFGHFRRIEEGRTLFGKYTSGLEKVKITPRRSGGDGANPREGQEKMTGKLGPRLLPI